MMDGVQPVFNVASIIPRVGHFNPSNVATASASIAIARAVAMLR
jgi:hypothetical protein